MSETTPQTCPINGELEPLLEALRQRFTQLTDDDCQRRLFVNRVRTLGSFGAEAVDYVQPEEAPLPKEFEIAFAVCHPECGNQAFLILEAGPQCCDRCGGTMLPVKFGVYRLKRNS